jgi:hypothetical protein
MDAVSASTTHALATLDTTEQTATSFVVALSPTDARTTATARASVCGASAIATSDTLALNAKSTLLPSVHRIATRKAHAS